MIAFAFTSTNTIHWMAILADAAVEGLAVLLLAAGATLLLRRSSAAVRHMTWTLSIAALILVPVLSLALPQLQVPLLPDWVRAVGLDQTDQPAVTPEPVALPSFTAAHHAPATELSLPAEPVTMSPADAGLEGPIPTAIPLTSSEQAPMHWSAWVLLAWLAGAALLLVPLLVGTAIVRRQTRRAQRIEGGTWLRLLEDLRRQLGIRNRVILLRSDWSNIPVACGILRPKIILPPEADSWSIERRRVILLHELAHIRRSDCLTQLLARLARVIYWFNPLVWLAGRMLRIEREQACDDLVLSSGQKASDYAQYLLDIVRSLHSVRCQSLAAVAVACKSQFEGRLLAILDPRRNRRALTRLGTIVTAALVTAAAIPLACMKATVKHEPADAASKIVATSQLATDSQASKTAMTTRKIEGKIVDADGKPIADAEIVVLQFGPNCLGFEYPLEQKIVGRTQSGADGKFFVVVAGIPQGAHLETIARKRDVGFGSSAV